MCITTILMVRINLPPPASPPLSPETGGSQDRAGKCPHVAGFLTHSSAAIQTRTGENIGASAFGALFSGRHFRSTVCGQCFSTFTKENQDGSGRFLCFWNCSDLYAIRMPA